MLSSSLGAAGVIGWWSWPPMARWISSWGCSTDVYHLPVLRQQRFAGGGHYNAADYAGICLTCSKCLSPNFMRRPKYRFPLRVRFGHPNVVPLGIECAEGGSRSYQQHPGALLHRAATNSTLEHWCVPLINAMASPTICPCPYLLLFERMLKLGASRQRPKRAYVSPSAVPSQSTDKSSCPARATPKARNTMQNKWSRWWSATQCFGLLLVFVLARKARATA